MSYESYLGILLVGSGARVFGLASQLVVLIILGRMLGKAEFGDLMTAFGFYRVVAIAVGTGASLLSSFMCRAARMTRSWRFASIASRHC